ncbi:MAG TPA: SRPBCC family protein, partial [Chroococcales cyanobacterium]
MSRDEFVYRSLMPATSEEVFAWHKRPGAFDRLTPPWANIEVVERTGGIEDGARVVLVVHNGPLAIRWTLEHKNYAEGRQFSDFQVDGPFTTWEQVHKVEPDGPNQSYLEDKVEYELPAGVAGELAAGFVIQHELERLFKYRHLTLAKDLEVTKQRVEPMKILVSGSTGLIGSQLLPFLTTQGHSVTRLVRQKSTTPKAGDPAQGKVYWDPARG